MTLRTVEVRRREFTPVGKMQQALDVVPLEGSVRLVDADTGATVGIQLADALDVERRAWLSRATRFHMNFDVGGPKAQARLSGIRYPLRVFGYTEPKPLRRRYGCSLARLYDDCPEIARMLDAVSAEWWAMLVDLVPDVAAAHAEAMRVVDPDWWIGGVPWTSGIINKTAALAYHRDAGNVKGTWSVMLALRRHMTGGHLYFPEYDAAISIPDGSLSMFSGQSIWHGVTPFHPTRDDAYRYTFVWYAKAGMKTCACRAEEPHRAAVRATKAEVDES